MTDFSRLPAPAIHSLDDCQKNWDAAVFRLVPYVNAKAYGAIGDGVTSDLSALQAAVDATPTGGTLLVPVGTYVLNGTLELKDKPIHLIGAGGRTQTHAAATYIQGAATKFTSTANASMIHVGLTVVAGPSYETLSHGTSITDIALEGTVSAGSSQTGLLVDNRGTNCTFENMMIAGCGGDGVRVTDCVSGVFTNVNSFRNAGCGWVLNTALATDSIAAITNTVFTNCGGNGNTSHGIVIKGNTWGNVWIGGVVEANGAYGVFMGDNLGKSVRFNRMVGMWSENNVTGSLRVADNSASDNDLDFVRVETTPSFVDAASRFENYVHYTDLTATGRGLRKSWQHAVIRGSGLDSSDTDHVAIRNNSDSDDGYIRSKRFYVTTGTVANNTTLGTLAPPFWSSGTGTPEAAVTAPKGSLFSRTDGGAGTTLYVKESGTGNTGWVGK